MQFIEYLLVNQFVGTRCGAHFCVPYFDYCQMQIFIDSVFALLHVSRFKYVCECVFCSLFF